MAGKVFCNKPTGETGKAPRPIKVACISSVISSPLSNDAVITLTLSSSAFSRLDAIALSRLLSFLPAPFFCKANSLSISLSRSTAFSLLLRAAAASSFLLSSKIRVNSAAVGSLSVDACADISYKCASYLLAD